MKKHIIFFAFAVLLSWCSDAAAQSAATQARMAEIRRCYAEAQKLAEDAMKGPKKNYMHVDFHTNDPNGYDHRTVDFFFDNSEILKELEVYPCQLVFVRDKSANIYTEYLFNKSDSELVFYYKRVNHPEEIYEQRFYFPPSGSGGEVWMTEKTTDAKTKKVVSEKQEVDEGAMCVWAYREAQAIRDTFGGMSVIFE